MPFLLEKCKKYRHKFVEAPNYQGASLVAQTVKNPPAMRETWVQSLGWEDPLKEGMATHSSILAWKIPWTEEPGGLQSMAPSRGSSQPRDQTQVSRIAGGFFTV